MQKKKKRIISFLLPWGLNPNFITESNLTVGPCQQFLLKLFHPLNTPCCLFSEPLEYVILSAWNSLPLKLLFCLTHLSLASLASLLPRSPPWFPKLLEHEMWDTPSMNEIRECVLFVLNFPVLIHNTQALETTQIPYNRWTDQEIVVYIHNGVLLSHKE
jgi:hypothetical protein